MAGGPKSWYVQCWARELLLPLPDFEPQTVQPVSSHCTHFTVPVPYSSVVFTEWDVIKIGELAQMRYLRLLVGLAVLDCQRNCNILNWLKIDNIVIVKALQKNWLDDLKQMHTLTLIQYVPCFWYILLSVQKMHNAFVKNFLFPTALLHVLMFARHP